MRDKYVLEHSSRGVFVDSVLDDVGVELKPRFSWSKLRHEGYEFDSEDAAIKERSRWPSKVRAKTKVVKIGI